MSKPTREDFQAAFVHFKKTLFQHFDENVLESVEGMHETVVNVLACYLAGEPDLVSPELQQATLNLKRITRLYRPALIEDMGRDLILFKAFLRAKGLGIRARLMGGIAKANAYEQTAEWAYRQLSVDLKW